MLQGIIEPIKIPTKDDEAEVINKSVDRAFPWTIPHLYQTFQVRKYVSDSGLEEGIWGLFKEVDVIVEEEDGTSGIRDVEREEQL